MCPNFTFTIHGLASFSLPAYSVFACIGLLFMMLFLYAKTQQIGVSFLRFLLLVGAMAAGVVVMFAGILFAFFKKYIVSFILSLGGMISFLKAGGYLIKRIQDKLSNSAVDQSLQNMDKEYMWRFYPIIGVAVISAALLICTIIRKLIERKRLQRERDNAPVESIID